MVKRDLLEPALAAEYLGGVPVQTLARWRFEGCGPAFLKLGGRVRYEVADLDAWLDAQRRTPTVSAQLDTCTHSAA